MLFKRFPWNFAGTTRTKKKKKKKEKAVSACSFLLLLYKDFFLSIDITKYIKQKRDTKNIHTTKKTDQKDAK